MAGSPLFVLRPDEDAEPYKAKVSHALTSLKGMVDKGGHGVYVMASTLGSMEALLTYLKEDCEIPVCGIRIGPVHKKDVIRASVMLEHKKVLPSSLASLSIPSIFISFLLPAYDYQSCITICLLMINLYHSNEALTFFFFFIFSSSSLFLSLTSSLGVCRHPCL